MIRINRLLTAGGYIRTMFVFQALLLSMLASGAVFAGQIKSVDWKKNSTKPILVVKTSAKASYQTRVFEGGKRLRITFHDTTLGIAMVDIEGRGIVKGVYPYLAGDGNSTNIDFLLHEPGKLKVSKKRRGYKITVSRLSSAKAKSMAAATSTADGNTITDVAYAKLPGDRVQITLKMSQTPAKPNTFTITNPARVSMDFAGTTAKLKKKSIPIRIGAVHGVTVVEAEDRTRVVLSLLKSVAYTARVEENAYVITVESPTGKMARDIATKTTRFAGAVRKGKFQINNIDFRRDPGGGAKILITLSDPSVGIDIREQAGEILVDFLNTSLPATLQRRLDVIDFATPVQTIDAFPRGRHSRIVITPHGKYEHLAYQAGDVFTVNVKPIPEAEADRKVDEFGYKGEKLSLNFQRIAVRDALQVLADFTGLNFVISDKVKGNLTLRLKDVPWDQALDIILETKGLGTRKAGNVVVIAPAKEIAAREKAQLEATKTVLDLEPLVSELIHINYAKAADIAALLKSVKAVESSVSTTSPFQTISYAGEQKVESNTLLSPRGQVTVDVRTNSILIQDTPSKIRQVRKLIVQLDQPVRQVMIETRLVEATDTFARSLGARFGVTRNDTAGGAGTAITGSLEGNIDMLNGDPLNANTDGLNINLPSTGIGTSNPAQIAFTMATLGGDLLQLELTALEQEGNGKIISSPRLITANQKKATIEQGQEREFSLGAGVSKIQTAVLKLDVTPQITPDDRIILDIVVTKDNFVDVSAGLKNKKKIQTNVLLDNGETVAIGGIYEQDEGETNTQVPVLGRLPLVGWMFKNRELKNDRTELLIFLTPRILSETFSMK